MAFQGADPGIVGASYEAPLELQDAQRCINWYVERDPDTRAKEATALLGCPGLNTVIATQMGAVRGAWVLPGGTTALVVTGNTLYLITNTIPGINGAPPIFTATSVGTLLTSVGVVVMRDNGVLQNGLGGYCLIVDGSFGYYYLLSGVTYTNQFTGSVIDGSATLTFPGELPNGLIVASTPTLSATSGAIPSGTKVIYIDTIGLTLTLSAPATATTTGTAITFTAPLALGATGGTLTPVWGGATGAQTIQFSDGETRLVTLTNGSGTVTWTSGLTGAVLAAATVVSGNTTETFTLTIPPFGQITDQGFLGADRIAFIEGFLVCNQPNSRTFFCTGPGPYSMLFPGLFFALKDSSTDNLVTLYEENRELWLVGERSSEVWYNAGGANFPFARIPGVGPQIGCSSKHSITRVGPQLVWLGANEQGQNMVVCTNQYNWQRISTHAVEAAISSYSTINDAIGYGYEEDGHLFFMLLFPTADKTWCFDFTSELWHERLSWDPQVGIYHRHRSNCFMNFANTRLVGDYLTGNLMQMSRQFYTDNGAPLRAVRRSPHVWAKQTRERVFLSQFQIEFMPAVGLQGLPAQGAPCCATLTLGGFPIAGLTSLSDNSGHNDFTVILQGNVPSAVWSISFTDDHGVSHIFNSSGVTPSVSGGFTLWTFITHVFLTAGLTYSITGNPGNTPLTIVAGSGTFDGDHGIGYLAPGVPTEVLAYGSLTLGQPSTWVPGSIPQAMLRYSNDAGQTWSNERWASIGKAGKTKNRAMWRQLGQARDRVWEVVVSDPVRRDIIGATLFAEGSSS
jgi:hypothetical protein